MKSEEHFYPQIAETIHNNSNVSKRYGIKYYHHHQIAPQKMNLTVKIKLKKATWYECNYMLMMSSSFVFTQKLTIPTNPLTWIHVLIQPNFKVNHKTTPQTVTGPKKMAALSLKKRSSGTQNVVNARTPAQIAIQNSEKWNVIFLCSCALSWPLSVKRSAERSRMRATHASLTTPPRAPLDQRAHSRRKEDILRAAFPLECSRKYFLERICEKVICWFPFVTNGTLIGKQGNHCNPPPTPHPHLFSS